MTHAKHLLSVTVRATVVFLPALLPACSGNSTQNEFMQALPHIAVTSPTARVQKSDPNAQLEIDSLVVKGGVGEVFAPFFKSLPARNDRNDSLRVLPEATESIRQTAQGSTTRALKQIQLLVRPYELKCFGAGLKYSSHPDGGPDTSTRGGDTGFVAAAEVENGVSVACPAATMNHKVEELGGWVNQALQLTAVSAAELQQNGRKFPKAVGAVAGTTLPDAGAFKDASVTVRRVAASKQSATYKWEYSANVVQGGGKSPVRLWLTHTRSATASDGGEESGRFWGSLPKGTDWYGFTLTYRVANGRTLYELKSAQSIGVGANGVSTTSPQFFSNEGVLLFESTLPRQNLFYAIADLDSASGLGKLKAAWADSATAVRSRVFEISTEEGKHGMDEGFAYFGFAGPLTDANIRAKKAVQANSMICAWSAGQKNFLKTGARAEHVGLVQAMRLARNGVTGEFEALPEDQHIAFCPTQSCNGAPKMRVDGRACDKPHTLAKAGLYGKVLIEAPTYP